MKMLNRVITGGYWGAYYLVYVLGVALLVYYFWDELLFLETRHLYVETLFLIGAIYAVSAGTALFVAIIVEVTGRMVLLIPRAWNRAKDEGRAEGLSQGRTEGRAEGLTEGLAGPHRRPGYGPDCGARRGPGSGPHRGPGGRPLRGTGPGAGHPVPIRAARPGNRAPRPGPGCRGTPAQRKRLGCPPAAFPDRNRVVWGSPSRRRKPE